MMFWLDGWRARVQRAAAVAVAVLLLASCGGGEHVRTFVAGRVLSFGDETSVMEAGGIKYSVNFIPAVSDTNPTPTIDCTQFPIWIQPVALAYGVPFPQCPSGLASTPSRILAAPGARVADVGVQINTFLASDAFAANDLVTMLAGTNDVFALYQQMQTGGLSSDQAVAAAEQAGTDMAAQVNRIAALGAKVLISTIPDESFSPDGRSDVNKAATLHLLTQRFNAKLRTGLVNDGRMIGLVLFDESVQAMVNNTAAFETATPQCNDATLADVRTCTSNTLRVLADGVTVATPGTWLWADRTHIGPIGHSTLGSLAANRAANNPF